jgi:hypothetical protein
MNQTALINTSHDPWVTSDGSGRQSSARHADEFFELCAEAACRNKLLPSVFYNAVLETGLCSPAEIGTPALSIALISGSFAFAGILKDTQANHLEAITRFALWVMEYKAKRPSKSRSIEVNTISSDSVQLHRAQLESVEALFATFAGLAEIAVNTASHPDLERNILIGIIAHRDILLKLTPPLPPGSHPKQNMLIPLNISAMLGRLEQLNTVNENAYQNIKINFNNTYGCSILNLNPCETSQNLAAVAIDLAMIMYLQNCNISQALCGLSRLEKDISQEFSENVCSFANQINQGQKHSTGNI